MKKIILSVLFCISVDSIFAQDIKIKVTSTSTGLSINGASISKNKKSFAATDSLGFAMILISGKTELEISAVGFNTASLKVNTAIDFYSVKLVPSETVMEDIVIVASTRTNQSIENAPIKI